MVEHHPPLSKSAKQVATAVSTITRKNIGSAAEVALLCTAAALHEVSRIKAAGVKLSCERSVSDPHLTQRTHPQPDFDFLFSHDVCYVRVQIADARGKLFLFEREEKCCFTIFFTRFRQFLHRHMPPHAMYPVRIPFHYVLKLICCCCLRSIPERAYFGREVSPLCPRFFCILVQQSDVFLVLSEHKFRGAMGPITCHAAALPYAMAMWNVCGYYYCSS